MIPSAMPPSSAARCACSQLLVGLPLQPHVELDAVGELVAQLRRRTPSRGSRASRGHSPSLVPLGERAPEREALQARALVLDVAVERRLASRRARSREHHLERRALRGPRGVAVDRAGVATVASTGSAAHSTRVRSAADR